MAPSGLIRRGGEVRLPKIRVEGNAWVYEDGLTEGNLLAIRFAIQDLSNEEAYAMFGPDVAQALIDRGYGKDQLPPTPTTVEEQRAAVERALRLGLVRDAHGRPAAR